MTASEIIEGLKKDPLERLKWLVLKSFGVLPGSKMARELSNEDFIFCAANMVIDARGAIEEKLREGGFNATFDENRFFELGEA